MNCYMCGTIVDGEDVCPHCGSDIKLYRRILISSEVLYNKGLEQAQVRDLSGAVISLKDSLKYNKYNTKARNLLGLVYFELGETVRALSEWVISKNFEADNPMADRYLSELQNTPGLLDSLDQMTKKYNQALLYCKQGSRDLAIIQLRKILGANSKFVVGHQLLALLYMQEGKYNDARKELNAAGKIDVKNTRTLRYAKEVREKLKEQTANKKKKPKNDLVAFQDGNDTVVMSSSSFREMLDGTRAGLGNIFAGLLIGLLVCFFLVVPTVRQKASENAAASIVDTNEELSNTTSSANSLKKQVEALEEELSLYTGKADAVSSYEKLMEAGDAFHAGNMGAAREALDPVNRDLLSGKGQALYDEVYNGAYAELLRNAFAEGNHAFATEDWGKACENFGYVISIDEGYEGGRALFSLAESQWNSWLFEDAAENYKKVLERYPNTAMSRAAESKIREFEEAQDQN